MPTRVSRLEPVNERSARDYAELPGLGDKRGTNGDILNCLAADAYGCSPMIAFATRAVTMP